MYIEKFSLEEANHIYNFVSKVCEEEYGECVVEPMGSFSYSKSFADGSIIGQTYCRVDVKETGDFMGFDVRFTDFACSMRLAGQHEWKNYKKKYADHMVEVLKSRKFIDESEQYKKDYNAYITKIKANQKQEQVDTNLF